VDQFGQKWFVGDRIDRVGEATAPLQMRDVVDRTGREVVEDAHLVAVVEEPFGEMRADEAGTAGDERLHARMCPLSNASIPKQIRSTSVSVKRWWSGSDRISRVACDATGQSLRLHRSNAG